MTLPRLYTDPRAGVAYAVGEKMSVGEKNAYRRGTAAQDLAIEHAIVRNWPKNNGYTVAGWNSTLVAAWSHVYHRWVWAHQDSGTPANPYAAHGLPHQGYLVAAGTQPTANLTIKDMTCGSSDGWVSEACFLCGDPTTPTENKVRWSDDGGATWFAGGLYKTDGNPASDTVSVDAICHHLIYGQLAIWIAGDATGRIFTTGWTSLAIWTQRTAANANAIRKLRSNGAIVVGISASSTNKCVRSRDGIDWFEGTLPVTAVWYDVCWVPQQFRWVAVGVAAANMVFCTSSDAITWQQVTVSSGLNLAYTPKNLLSSGNLLVLTAGIYVYISSDFGATWRQAHICTGWTTVTAAATSMDASTAVNQILLGGPKTTGTDTNWLGSFVGS